MAMILPLDRMSTEEKLRALEELWADLSRAPDTVPAPQWHGELLEAREQRVKDGTASYSEWVAAKQRILDRIR
ncbi:MAG TPA: addiction module protein [Gammaproteobacteria bacterium]